MEPRGGDLDPRQKRLADNEILFRSVNERILSTAEAHGIDEHMYEFLCECSNIDCTLRLRLTIAEYEHVRANAARFLIAPGHELPEIEIVTLREERFWTVEKQGAAADLVEEHDPRE